MEAAAGQLFGQLVGSMSGSILTEQAAVILGSSVSAQVWALTPLRWLTTSGCAGSLRLVALAQYFWFGVSLKGLSIWVSISRIKYML